MACPAPCQRNRKDYAQPRVAACDGTRWKWHDPHTTAPSIYSTTVQVQPRYPKGQCQPMCCNV
eukprot:6289223-Amphidinium_carterae.1